MRKNAGNNDGLGGFNQWAIQRFGVEHANMSPDSPNKYFDAKMSDLYTYLDMQIIEQIGCAEACSITRHEHRS